MKGIEIKDGKIYINGKREKIYSGSAHYFRILPEQWEDRLIKMKEAGLNCVETYICWNLHEKKEGEFDFGGNINVGKYLDLCKDLGLYAIVRPGPYICSEWEFGGFPWWLNKYPMNIRSMDKRYLDKLTPYLKKVCEIIKPREIGNGGNVIAVQIENEYGSYGNDKNYLNYLKEFYLEQGISSMLITSDGDTDFTIENGTLKNVADSVNYRSDTKKALSALEKYHGGYAPMIMELWNGRAVRWGEKPITRDPEIVKRSVETAVKDAELTNIYMFTGGTNFGFMNGAHEDEHGKYVPLSTSYDVEAPISEYGKKTPKYYYEQEAICRERNIPVVNERKDEEFMDYGKAEFIGATELFKHEELIKRVNSNSVLSMEECEQGYGYIAYKTIAFVSEKGGDLVLENFRDVAHVYFDGKYIATAYYDKKNTTHIPFPEVGKYVEITVVTENLGRVNLGRYIGGKRGVTSDFAVWDKSYNVLSTVFGYEMLSVPMEKLPETYEESIEENKQGFYKFVFNAEQVKSAVLTLKGFTRGVAYINGFNLGRHWDIENSENKLYVPYPLVKKGKNEIVVFDVLTKKDEKTVELKAK